MFTVRHISQHEGYCGGNPPRPLIASSFLVTCLLFIFSEAAFHSGYCFRCPGFNCLSPVTRASCLMAFAHAWRLGIWRWMIYINDGRWWKRLGNDMGKENDIRQLRPAEICVNNPFILGAARILTLWTFRVVCIIVPGVLVSKMRHNQVNHRMSSACSLCCLRCRTIYENTFTFIAL